MTVKEYKEWLTRRKRECFESLNRQDSNNERNVGRSSAFDECLKKLPDFFDGDEKLQVDSDSIAAETAYTMEKIKELRKDMASKIQSNTDKMENLKKQLKIEKERSENGWERVRYLERKLKDVESLNDQLLRELVRRQCEEETGE